MYLEKLDNARKALAEAETLEDIKKLESAFKGNEQALKACHQYVDETGEMQNTAAEMKIRAQRKGGKLIANLEKTPGKRKDLTSARACRGSTKAEELEKVGMKPGVAGKWEKIASVPNETFERHVTQKKESKEELTSTGILNLANNIHISDDSYEWFTPIEIIESARIVMGSINLDPASCEEANKIINADNFYTKETDGLNIQWSKNIWLNPPYSMPHIKIFTQKAMCEYEKGKISQALILVNNATDTNWFQSLFKYPVCFFDGRVKFWNPNKNNLGARQGQAIFYLGNNTGNFINEFGKYGTLLCRLKTPKNT